MKAGAAVVVARAGTILIAEAAIVSYHREHIYCKIRVSATRVDMGLAEARLLYARPGDSIDV